MRPPQVVLVLLGWLGAGEGCREGCSTTNLTSCKLIPTQGPHPFLFLTVLEEEVGELGGELWAGCPIVDYLEVRARGVTSIEGSPFLSLANLSTLDLSNNSIQFITADAFRGLSKLSKLNLDWCGVKVIEDGAFDELAALRFLYLSHNCLFDIPPSLPSTLDSLDLSHNQIKHLVFRTIAVRELNLCENRLEGGVESLLSVGGLEELCLTMPGLEGGTPPPGKPQWPKLTRLVLSFQQRAPLPTSFQQLIAHLPAITHLSIENCSVSSVDWLRGLQGLEELWLQGVLLEGGGSLEPLRLPRLELLSLEGSPSLLPLLLNSTSLPNLQHLRLRSAGVERLEGWGGGLRSVDLSENPLDCSERDSWGWLTSAPELLSHPEDSLCQEPPHLRNSPILFALEPDHRLAGRKEENAVEAKGGIPSLAWVVGGLCLAGFTAPFVWLALRHTMLHKFNINT